MATDTPGSPPSLEESISYYRTGNETSRTRLVNSPEQAAENIARYQTEIGNARYGMELKKRMKRVNAWYAIRSNDGSWLFAPSKYVGYSENTAAAYLSEAGDRDGRKTEHVLADWFHVVSADSRRGSELVAALQRFLEANGHSGPKQHARICVLREVLEELDGVPETAGRIRVDPEICGGRPHVLGNQGARVRYPSTHGGRRRAFGNPRRLSLSRGSRSQGGPRLGSDGQRTPHRPRRLTLALPHRCATAARPCPLAHRRGLPVGPCERPRHRSGDGFPDRGRGAPPGGRYLVQGRGFCGARTAQAGAPGRLAADSATPPTPRCGSGWPRISKPLRPPLQRAKR